ncbi:MAG: cytochrome c biogenesis protein CcsA [Pirellulaceae bacterium]|nr:cytochrome c biogenesis protein CcsA [Pirellulaceae bacterium]
MTTVESFPRGSESRSALIVPQVSTQRWMLAVLEGLGSLKLTVGLLVVAVFVVWVSSMQQTRMDIWAVKSQHFSSPIVRIPYNVFLPPAWFPDQQKVQGACHLPSGLTILIAMMINLLAAHLVRMRIQATGNRLFVGLMVAVLGIVVTWMVVAGGQNPDGFQASASPEFFRRLWWLMHVVVFGLGLAAGFYAYQFPRERTLEKIGLGFIGAALLALLIFLISQGEQAFIGDSAMRILWQLIQGTMAAAVMMVACALLFKRKGAVVLIHIGIMMLMANELYVSLTNVEQQMTVFEGETTSLALDIRNTEMVVVDASNSEETKITTIPSSRLQGEKVISHPDLPFDLRPKQYFINANLERINAGDTQENLASAGLGRVFRAVQLPPTPAVGSERAHDRAAAYVEILEKGTGTSLGTYLISMLSYDNEVLDTVAAQDKSFQIGLRLKTYIKPYEVHLVDAEKTVYPGTNTPKSFSSDLLLTDERRGLIDSPQRVWMNNPLRYGNETFYQSGMDTFQGRELTVLQIVKNSGWMIPYVACMFVVLGLVFQFSGTLEKMLQGTASATANGTNPFNRAAFVVLLLLLGLPLAAYGLRALSAAARPKVVLAEMRLDQLGQIPLLYQGRMQPLDSLARNTARQLCAREEVLGYDENKRPAIRWFADTIFRQSGWETYRILRITDLHVLNELKLTPASPFLYSFEDLAKPVEVAGRQVPRFMILEEQVTNARKLPVEELSIGQKRLVDLYQKITKVKNLQAALGDPKHAQEQDGFAARLQIGSRLAEADDLPLLVQTDAESDQWITLATAHNRRWLAEYAQKLGATNSTQLAEVIMADQLEPGIRRELVNEETLRVMQQDPEIQEIVARHRSQADAENSLLAELRKLPEEKLRGITVQAEANVAMQMERIVKELVPEVRRHVEAIGFYPELASQSPTTAETPIRLERLMTDRNADEFNAALASYLTEFKANNKLGWRLPVEILYNFGSPFYLAMVFYLFGAIVAVCGFVVLPREIGRVAMVILIAGLSIHFFGILLRIMISGRPPVTTLYSSAIFISACCVGLLLIVERLTRINVGSFLAGASGLGMLLWAWTMSIKDGDTFTVLVAVLDTQFWLSTHVICISLGYVATYAAGAVGIGALMIWLVGYLRGTLPKLSPTIQSLANVVYGITCFALLFSFFGTVLGGLWADDSWGRFWGWDTKENGALMIVFWNAVLLHARWAGIIRAKGIAAVATLGIAVTFWSWQGVNLLGVGLHNYGFSEEGLQIMFAILGSSILVSMIGLIPEPKDLRRAA